MKIITLIQALTYLQDFKDITSISYEDGNSNKFLITASNVNYYVKLSGHGKIDAMVKLS